MSEPRMRFDITRPFRDLWAEARDYWPRSWPKHHPLAALMILGIFFQFAQYAYHRPYWMDESSLHGNIAGRSPWDWSTPLAATQLAPLGFLTVERSLATLSGANPPSWLLRLVPLSAGIAAMIAIALLAKLSLSPTAGKVAVALLAISPTVIYFASELKPYIGDLSAALWVYLIAWRLDQKHWSAPAIIGAGCGGASLIWFSFPVAFVLGAIGLVGIAQDLAARRWRRSAIWLGLAALWLISFAIHWKMCRALLGGSPGMWVFWNFAFPPWPTNADQAIIWPRTLLNLFVNPLDYQRTDFVRIPFLPVLDIDRLDSYQGMPIGTIPALIMFSVGAWITARSQPAWLARWLLPIALGTIAAALRLYPLHGRLALYALPALIVLIAQGASAVKTRSEMGWRIVLAALLLEPLIRMTGVGLGLGPIVHGWNRVGDLE